MCNENKNFCIKYDYDYYNIIGGLKINVVMQ